MNDLAVQADLLELNTAIDNRFGVQTMKLNCKGEVRGEVLVEVLLKPSLLDRYRLGL